MAALAAFRHARLEEVVADAPPVGERLEHALRRDGPGRAPDSSSVRKALLKNSSRAVGGRLLLRRDKHRYRRSYKRNREDTQTYDTLHSRLHFHKTVDLMPARSYMYDSLFRKRL